jgi:hypothetical protein
MKTFTNISLFALLVLLFSFTEEVDPKSALDAKLNIYKQECKEMIKPARYEGSRTTYFTLRKKPQVKSVELFLLLDNEYVFGISGKECSTSVTVRFYDTPDQATRTLIMEQKGINGKNNMFSSKDLNALYRKKVPQAERLKNLFIEYDVASGEQKLEGIVMVIGNK